jgi:hypothetical protein
MLIRGGNVDHFTHIRAFEAYYAALQEIALLYHYNRMAFKENLKVIEPIYISEFDVVKIC